MVVVADVVHLPVAVAHHLVDVVLRHAVVAADGVKGGHQLFSILFSSQQNISCINFVQRVSVEIVPAVTLEKYHLFIFVMRYWEKHINTYLHFLFVIYLFVKSSLTHCV